MLHECSTSSIALLTNGSVCRFDTKSAPNPVHIATDVMTVRTDCNNYLLQTYDGRILLCCINTEAKPGIDITAIICDCLEISSTDYITNIGISSDDIVAMTETRVACIDVKPVVFPCAGKRLPIIKSIHKFDDKIDLVYRELGVVLFRVCNQLYALRTDEDTLDQLVCDAGNIREIGYDCFNIYVLMNDNSIWGLFLRLLRTSTLSATLASICITQVSQED